MICVAGDTCSGASKREGNFVWFIGSDVLLFCRHGHLFFHVFDIFSIKRLMEDTRRRSRAAKGYNSIGTSETWGLRVIEEWRRWEQLRRVRSYFLLDRPLSSGTTCIIRRNRDCLPAPNGHGRHFWRATLSAIYILSQDHRKAVTSWTEIPRDAWDKSTSD